MIQRLFCRGYLRDNTGRLTRYPVTADVTLTDDEIVIRLLDMGGELMGEQREKVDAIRDSSLIAAATIIARTTGGDGPADDVAWRIVQLARAIDKERRERPKE